MRRGDGDQRVDTPPRIDVVLPVRDEAAYLRRSLGSVLRQDLPADRVRVFVVDGGSTDGTPDLARELAREHDAVDRVELLDNPERIAATAMNRGIDAGDAPFVARVDGHSELAPDYLRLALDALERTGADAVGGVLRSEGEGLVGQAIALAMSSRLGTGGAGFRSGVETEQETDTVAFPVYRRSVFDRVGPFDERLVRNQDDEFNQRLRQSDGRIVLSPQLRVAYVTRGSLLGLARQYLGYGFWKPRVIALRGLPSIRALAPPVLVVGLLLASVVTLVAAPLPVYAVIPWFAHAAICCAVGLAVADGRPGLGFLTGAAYVVQHLSYGVGFLAGAMVPLPRRLESPT